MSLRAIKLNAYVIACDACGAKSTNAGLMPVEAEIRAVAKGWKTATNPLLHVCNVCLVNRKRSA